MLVWPIFSSTESTDSFMTEKMYIIGAGPGSEELLTLKASNVIHSADRVLGTQRIARHYQRCTGLHLSELFKELEHPVAGVTAVLVGGDCCFYSVTSRIRRDFSSLYEIEQINGIGSLAYFSAKIGINYDDARLISFHGRNERTVSLAAYNKKVFVLAGGEHKVHDLCRELLSSGLANVQTIVGEKLSYSDEKIVYGTPATLENETFDDLSVMYIGNENARCPHLPLRDDDFIRFENIPMTKEEVRRLTLGKLAISPKDILYDIGAGTGSVAVEMGRHAFEGIVYAVERHSEACRLIEMNRVRHGAYNINVVHADAPEGLDRLPPPDAAFIGGSSGSIKSVIDVLITKNPAVRIVANAVSLQGLYRIHEAFQRFDPREIEVTCVNIAQSKRIDVYDLMTAQNPVYIICRHPCFPSRES